MAAVRDSGNSLFVGRMSSSPDGAMVNIISVVGNTADRMVALRLSLVSYLPVRYPLGRLSEQIIRSETLARSRYCDSLVNW